MRQLSAAAFQFAIGTFVPLWSGLFINHNLNNWESKISHIFMYTFYRKRPSRFIITAWCFLNMRCSLSWKKKNQLYEWWHCHVGAGRAFLPHAVTKCHWNSGDLSKTMINNPDQKYVDCNVNRRYFPQTTTANVAASTTKTFVMTINKSSFNNVDMFYQ